MSERVYEGTVNVEKMAQTGMLTLRGDLSSKVITAGVKRELGLSVPGVREVVSGDTGVLVWMSPDELFATLTLADIDAKIAGLTEAFGNEHHLVVDVSDARAMFRLTGAGAREVLAKGAPVDLSRDAFGLGQVRRTRLGQVAVAFWMSGEDQFDLVCFRSVGDFVFDWLSVAAKPGSLPEYL